MVRVEQAGPEAIPAIMRFERQPGNETLVGRWSEAEHREAMAEAGTAYLLGYDGDAPRGFAMLRALEDPNGNVLLKRIAVEGVGQGFGRPFLVAVIDWVFAATAAHRLHLNVFEHNTRAQRVYLSSGFVQEGIQRQNHRRPDGTRVSMLVMSMLRPEWEALRGGSVPRAATS